VILNDYSKRHQSILGFLNPSHGKLKSPFRGSQIKRKEAGAATVSQTSVDQMPIFENVKACAAIALVFLVTIKWPYSS